MSSIFLGYIGYNLLFKKVMKVTRGTALLDLILTNRDEWLLKMKAEGNWDESEISFHDHDPKEGKE